MIALDYYQSRVDEFNRVLDSHTKEQSSKEAILQLLKDYARLKCHEQRKNCFVSWDKGGSSNAEMKANIVNAPTPEM